ncbi:MAG: serine/threonine protein kinase [Nannocystis sp.]|nr:serine/threonine protein kinase [Nannocystis sp.]
MSATGLQRYQVIGLLGEGSQGQTLRALDRATGQEVAIKVLRLAKIDDWKAFDLFERECQVLERLDHPGIPRFIDRFASEGTGEFFLVRELIEGEPLSQRLAAHRRLPEPELRRLLDQALEILAYLHHQTPPIIHRDLKPSNFVLGRDDRLRLIDYGGVRVAPATDGGSTMIGTYGYMAPEQLHGEVSPAVDIYALGATLAALAAGTDADKLARQGLRIDLTRVLPASPLQSVLARMLAPDPNERLRSVDDVRAALAAAPAAPSSAPVPESSLDLLPEPLRALARVGRPFSILIWIIAALAVGVFIVLEVALLPLFFAVAQRLSGEGDDKRRLRGQREEAQRAIKSARRGLQALAERAHPLREEPRSLPPGDRDH